MCLVNVQQRGTRIMCIFPSLQFKHACAYFVSLLEWVSLKGCHELLD